MDFARPAYAGISAQVAGERGLRDHFFFVGFCGVDVGGKVLRCKHADRGATAPLRSDDHTRANCRSNEQSRNLTGPDQF